MKKLYGITLALIFVSSIAISQNASLKKEETCLEAWQKEFTERGAFPVEDGTYKNVVVSLVSGSGTECFYGKVRVENNHVTTIYLSYEDNSYEYFDRTYKGDTRAKINNGITDPLTTTNGEKVYVVFIDKLKPKKKQFKKAPKPGGN